MTPKAVPSSITCAITLSDLAQGGLQRPSEGRRGPVARFRPGPVSTATRAHSTDEDPTVRSHPSRGGAVHPKLERYIDMLNSSGFGGREKPHGSVVTHRRAG